MYTVVWVECIVKISKEFWNQSNNPQDFRQQLMLSHPTKISAPTRLRIPPDA
jgi:hypothetical protein